MSRPSGRVGIQHLPALDGLRGLAVLGVLLFHDHRLRGGYLGVDLFFVLSGYLITSLLLSEWATTGGIDLRAFWVRRARRLFPALLVLVPAVGLYAALMAAPVDRGRIRADGLATLAYVANWWTLRAGHDYWSLFAAPSPLEHTWSLAIEEQFYVVWPVLAYLVLRVSRGSARALLACAAALGVCSAAAMWVLQASGRTSHAYLGTDARGAAILAGAVLACARAKGGQPPSEVAVRALDALGMVAAAGLAVAWALLDGQAPFLYRGGFWLTELAVLVLIACAAHDRRSLVARALGFRPLAAVGLISYGLYLWHWPVFVALTRERTGLGPWRLSALRFAVTFAVSLVSYRFVERPIRARGLPFGRPVVVVPLAAAASLLSLVVGTRGAVAPLEAGMAEARTPASERWPKTLVFGDSVALALGERLRAVQEGFEANVVVRAVGDCSILHDQLPTRSLNNRAHDGGDCDAAWVRDAAEVRPRATLIVLGGGFFAPVQIDGRWQRPCEDGWQKAYRAELARNLAALGPDGGRRFVALVPYPVGAWAEATPKRIVDCFNGALREAAAAVPGVALLDLSSRLCPGGACALESDGAPIRPDGLHFSGVGAEEIARWTLDQMR